MIGYCPLDDSESLVAAVAPVVALDPAVLVGADPIMERRVEEPTVLQIRAAVALTRVAILVETNLATRAVLE